MRSIYRTVLVLLCLTALASAAAAENPFYLTGKLASTTTDDDFGQAFTQIIDGDDEGYSLGLGFKLGKFLAFQAEYHDLGKAPGVGAPCPDDPAIGCVAIIVPVQADSTAISVSVLPRWQASDRFSIYGKLGVVSWESDVSTALDTLNLAIDSFEDEELLFGAGLHYQLPGPFGFFAEYENIADTFETVALGATFGF
ncbi:MAG: outer membrane beta-barrel protein [bacterium]|nr:outer membrane beta-barrel protein [bacterium]